MVEDPGRGYGEGCDLRRVKPHPKNLNTNPNVDLPLYKP